MAKIVMAVAGLLTGVVVIGFIVMHSHDGKHSHSHGHHADVQKLTLDDGSRWRTDGPLRLGMGRIRDAVNAAEASGEVDADEAARVAGVVEHQVKFLFANCELEPRADAMLHLVIGQMINSASALREDPKSPRGLPMLREALTAYEHHFEPAYDD